jgi:hypothetical protein
LHAKATKECEEVEALRIRQLEETKIRRDAQRAAIKSRAAQINPEPANGIQLAICFPDQKRVVRKFAREDFGDDVFAFVVNLDRMFDGNSNSVEFFLLFGPRHLQAKQTLAQQGITARTMIHVVPDE